MLKSTHINRQITKKKKEKRTTWNGDKELKKRAPEKSEPVHLRRRRKKVT